MMQGADALLAWRASERLNSNVAVKRPHMSEIQRRLGGGSTDVLPEAVAEIKEAIRLCRTLH